MTIYKVDSSCYIESQLPRQGEMLFHTGSGRYLGDEFVIEHFDSVERAIDKDDHNGLEERVKKLEDVNAAFKYVQGSSYTLLDKAVKKGCLVCTEVLLKAGAKTDIKNREGKTAEMLALEQNNKGIIDLIEKSKPVSKIILEKKIECQLSFKSSKQLLAGLGFGESYCESYEGSFVFGNEYADRASVLFYHTVNSPYRNTKHTISFTVIEMEYEGQQAFKINYDKSNSVVLTPNTEKYQMGKDNLFIKKKEKPKNQQDECIIS